MTFKLVDMHFSDGLVVAGGSSIMIDQYFRLFPFFSSRRLRFIRCFQRHSQTRFVFVVQYSFINMNPVSTNYSFKTNWFFSTEEGLIVSRRIFFGFFSLYRFLPINPGFEQILRTKLLVSQWTRTKYAHFLFSFYFMILSFDTTLKQLHYNYIHVMILHIIYISIMIFYLINVLSSPQIQSGVVLIFTSEEVDWKFDGHLNIISVWELSGYAHR